MLYTVGSDDEADTTTVKGFAAATPGARVVIIPHAAHMTMWDNPQANLAAVRDFLREEDLEEHFVSSGGPGGQKVNRSATCVCLRHVPAGVEVKMQKARSQSLNRFYARRRLCELIEARTLGQQSPEALLDIFIRVA